MTDIFKVPVNQYLGNDYSVYKNRLFGVAISSPKEYFALREAVVKVFKEKAIGNLYDSVYEAMVNGNNANGTPLVNGAFIPSGLNGVFKPSVPAQEVNKITLGLAKTLDSALDECLELILPVDYHALASKRLEAVGNAGLSV